MRFSKLVEYWERIESTPKRLEMMEILSELLKEAGGEEVEQVVNLSLGQLRPKFDRLEFSLAEKMVIRAIAQAAGEKGEEITKVYKRVGDLGLVAEESVGGLQSSSVRVLQVYTKLEEIAEDAGQGSQERKVGELADLLREVSGVSGKYLVRVVLGKLRLGFLDKTVLDALSFMEHGTKEGRAEIDRAYQVFPDVGKLAKYVKESGIASLGKKVRVCVGVPVLPALAQRLKTADEMVKKMGKVVVEPKFDGTRVAIHFKRDGFGIKGEKTLFGEGEAVQVRSFTRNLDENSSMFPELATIAKQIKAGEVILDSEAVGYDPKTGKQLPFQQTITRKRKHGVRAASEEVPLKFQVFDILYKDGESLLDEPLVKRREVLVQVVGGEGPLKVDEALVTDDPNKIREYHGRKLAEGLEGAMCKKAGGKYLPGRQDWNWVKFKEAEDSRAKLSDTLDLVVMGYYKGRGRRAVFEFGALLAGVRDGEKVKTIAKIGTGISDLQFGELDERMKRLKQRTADRRYEVGKSLVPDVWLAPLLVVEVAADEITRSPAHSSGVALRFPRLVRVREDKDLEQVTTIEEVEEIGG